MSQASSVAKRLMKGVGLSTVLAAPSDVHWLLMSRFVRLIAFGQTSLIMVLFFKSIGVSEVLVGVFMSLTLAGDVVISFVLTMYADKIGRRRILLAGAAMMILSGSVFVLSQNFYVLLLAAIIGVVSPTGNEIGPFRAVEESAMAQLVSLESRADVYAWNTVLGGLGSAIGSITAGIIVQICQSQFDASPTSAYKAVFALYSIWGIAKFILSMLLSPEIELPEELKPEDEEEAEGFLVDEPAVEAQEPRSQSFWSKLVPELSKESRKIVLVLSLLFALDAFASSLTSMAWNSYYVARKFSIPEGTLGTIFFITGVIGSLASLLGAIISRSLGPLLTMVVTHLPSSTLLMFVPYPSSVGMTLAILVLRSCTATMDVAPRQVFLSAVVLQKERTAVMGWVNVVKTMAQMGAPYITGVLTHKDKQWICYVVAGALKVMYDLGILATFLNVKLDRDHQ